MSSCPSRVGNSTPPYAVSLLYDICDATTPNLLHVRRPPRSPTAVDFTVCVTPLNFRYNNYHQLVETVEVLDPRSLPSALYTFETTYPHQCKF